MRCPLDDASCDLNACNFTNQCMHANQRKFDVKCPLQDNAFCLFEGCYDAGKCQRIAVIAASVTGDNIVQHGLMNCPTYRCPCSLEECSKAKRCKYLQDPQQGNGAKSSFYCCATKPENCVTQCAGCQLIQAERIVPNASVEPAPPMKSYQSAKKPCHEGVYYLGQCGKANIYVGKESQVGRRPYYNSTKDFKLIVSLIESGGWFSKENKGDEFLVTGNAAAKACLPEELFRQDKPIPFLHVAWPDYGAVALGRDWWASFISAVAKIDGDVVLYCMGGHGRTGSAAAILAVLCDWCPRDYCPVAWVRDTYCPEVVESEVQIEYIEEITGAKVISKPAKWYGSQYNMWENRGGTSATSEPTKLTVVARADDDEEDEGDITPSLSNNKYKKHAARLRRAGHKMPTIKEMEDRYETVVDGNLFEWNAVLSKFEWLAYIGEDEQESVSADPGKQEQPDPVG